MSNSIIINDSSDGNGDFNITFSKERLQDFIESLVKTPREEVFRISAGFDVNKADLKILSDKISYHINTQHQLISQEFQVSAIFGDDDELSVNSYEQFFHADELRPDNPLALVITMSFLIGLRRPGENISYEKQTVSMSFMSGDRGMVVVRIRSTEMTWSAGIAKIIETEVRKIESRTTGSPIPKENPYLFLSRLFRKDLTYPKYMMKIRDQEKFYARIRTLPFIILFLFSLPLFLTLQSLTSPFIYDQTSNSLKAADVEQLISNIGIEAAMDEVRLGDALRRYSNIDRPSLFNTLTASMAPWLKETGRWIAMAFILVSLYLYLCAQHAAKIDDHFKSRIFLHFGPITHPREKTSWITGVIPSLSIGILGGLIATLLAGLLSL